METDKYKKYWLGDSEDFRHDMRPSDILYICVVYKRHTHEGVVWSVMNPNTGAVNFIKGHRHVKNIFTHVSICRLPWITWVFN